MKIMKQMLNLADENSELDLKGVEKGKFSAPTGCTPIEYIFELAELRCTICTCVTLELHCSQPTSQNRVIFSCIFAFVKERFHNAVEIDILGIFEEYSSLQIWPPQNIFQARNYSGRMT